jgi:DNA-binding ferritin-like protein
MIKEPIIAPDEIEENPVGLKDSQISGTVDVLNQIVSSMFIQFHQYQKHHWMVEGPTFRDLHIYFEESYNAVHESLDGLAERMTVLGGVPTASPQLFADFSVIKHEEEGVFAIRTMLENDLNNERKIAQFIREAIPAISEKKDFASETLLKQVLITVEDRAHHLDHYLSNLSLENGRESEESSN